jgi:hypothetical protein
MIPPYPPSARRRRSWLGDASPIDAPGTKDAKELTTLGAANKSQKAAASGSRFMETSAAHESRLRASDRRHTCGVTLGTARRLSST